jgi:hypothetical protein
MTAILRRRGSVIAAFLLVLALAAVLVSTSLSGARAQETTFTVWIIQDQVTASNGNATIDFALEPGEAIVTASCAGSSPRSGANIPAQVVTQIVNGRAVVRILGNTGSPLNATVTVNCDIGVEGPAAPTTLKRPNAHAVKG